MSKNAKKVLLRHIQEAIEDKHTNSLVNKCTNLLIEDALTGKEYCFYNHSKV